MTRNRTTFVVLGFVALVLASAAFFQVRAPDTLAPPASSRVAGKLSEMLPRSLAGWTSRELPLGENELLRKRTEGILQFDDYVYREFARGGSSFTVYAAYWEVGKMPTRLVSLHTPDRCWIENGWTSLDRRNRQIIFADRQLPPGEWRVFSPPGGRGNVYTAFWLLVGGRPYDFGSGLNTIPNPLKWWANVVAEARGGRSDHLFVRITAERPFDGLAHEPVWGELAEALRRIGLRESAPH